MPGSNMDHFYTSIQGWFGFQNLYSEAVAKAEDGAHFVEVGSWKGKSASYMAVEIINSGKRIRFDCVDTWRGSEEHQDPSSCFYVKELEDPDWLMNQFLSNTAPVKACIHPVRMKSVSAAATYADGSLDFVFIDAAHDYQSVVDDIRAWGPKMKPGGTLAGHDYQREEVQRAVHHVLGSDVRISEWCWIHVTPSEV